LLLHIARRLTFCFGSRLSDLGGLAINY
jgi:hypothetical protein